MKSFTITWKPSTDGEFPEEIVSAFFFETKKKQIAPGEWEIKLIYKHPSGDHISLGLAYELGKIITLLTIKDKTIDPNDLEKLIS